MFTGQWYDSEIGQYYLRARMYDPQLMRLTSRDPAFGDTREPMTFHKYLYCLNDPMNNVDPTGQSLWNLLGEVIVGSAVRSASILTMERGIVYDNDMLFDIGLQMNYFVPPAMALGAVLGPYMPESAVASATQVWNALTATASYTAGATLAAARGIALFLSQHTRMQLLLMH